MKNKLLRGDYIDPSLLYKPGDEIKYITSKPLNYCSNGFLPKYSLTDDNELLICGKIYNFESALYKDDIFTLDCTGHEYCTQLCASESETVTYKQQAVVFNQITACCFLYYQIGDKVKRIT